MSLKRNYEYIRDWVNMHFLRKDEQLNLDLSDYSTKDYVKKQIDKIDFSPYVRQSVYNEDEQTISASLNDLNDRISLTSRLLGLEPIKVTHDELVETKHAGNLKPGRLYRITDYEFDSVEVGVDNAGHPFDIVLLALSESELSEEGSAVPHEGDDYFANSNLGAWKIWYCLEPTIERFDLSVERRLEGSIRIASSNLYKFNNYYTTFNWWYPDTVKDLLISLSTNGELDELIASDHFSDDFKNLVQQMGWAEDEVLYVVNNKYQPGETGNRYFVTWAYFSKAEVENGIITKGIVAGRTGTTYGTRIYEQINGVNFIKEKRLIGGSKGIIYRMIDEFNNDVNYDFKNKLITYDGYTYMFNDEAPFYSSNIIMPSYTFSDVEYDEDSETYSCTDKSLTGKAYDNFVRTRQSKNSNYVDAYNPGCCVLGSTSESIIKNCYIDNPIFTGIYAENIDSIRMDPNSKLAGNNCKNLYDFHLFGGANLGLYNVDFYGYTGMHYSSLLWYNESDSISYASNILLGPGEERWAWNSNMMSNVCYITAYGPTLPDYISLPYQSGNTVDITSEIENNLSSDEQWRLKNGFLSEIMINGSYWYRGTYMGYTGMFFKDYGSTVYVLTYDSVNSQYIIQCI